MYVLFHVGPVQVVMYEGKVLNENALCFICSKNYLHTSTMIYSSKASIGKLETSIEGFAILDR